MENKMEIIELLLDEENDVTGIEAVSIVEAPAIESDFITLKSQEIQLAKVDDEKKILMGAALIPNKPIYRKQGEKEYYVYFSNETVRKASELFFKNGNQNNATLEHKLAINDLTVVESWIVENKEKDKTALYGLDVPEGTWMISMKVNNDEIWNDFVKTGKVKGFSIEGYFADKAKLDASAVKVDVDEEKAKQKIEEIKNLFTQKKKVKLESYSDYPKAALRWSKSKLKELGEIELASMVIDDEFAIIDDRLAYSTQEKAEETAKNIGCKGFHTHIYQDLDGKEKTWYMPCEKHIND
tara:strand:+ start:10820 stop:11710 length:891 start_codon:yes stop_codon:yes gene_type:complete